MKPPKGTRAHCTDCGRTWDDPRGHTRACKAQEKTLDLDSEPLGQCNRCGRDFWKRESIGTVDEMTQPDGEICGGRFFANGEGKV